MDWKHHKHACKLSSQSEDKKSEEKADDLVRISRCMFCGESLLLKCEEDAVSHMR